MSCIDNGLLDRGKQSHSSQLGSSLEICCRMKLTEIPLLTLMPWVACGKCLSGQLSAKCNTL